MQYINYTRNLDKAVDATIDATMLFIIEETTGTVLYFSQGIIKHYNFTFCFNIK